ncbi:MAG: phosphoribosylformylglycinamidine synthase subunit PurS [Thermomicrobium sp.]|nr:phosphoribosylformylglycinamidine synthase subunit PurS [Thermomicrobium sp.]MDW8007732.1 phosphoribosylformylglycinamidine synthase subunit PurS [Thermomicrobium sp.]
MSDTARWRAEVYVSLRPGVNDPQGLAVRDGLRRLGYDEVEEVRVGRFVQVWLTAPDAETAHRRVAAMCEQLLANPVVEQYRFTIEPAER